LQPSQLGDEAQNIKGLGPQDEEPDSIGNISRVEILKTRQILQNTTIKYCTRKDESIPGPEKIRLNCTSLALPCTSDEKLHLQLLGVERHRARCLGCEQTGAGWKHMAAGWWDVGRPNSSPATSHPVL